MNLPLRISSARARFGATAPFADNGDLDHPAQPERGIDARAALVVFLVAAIAASAAGLLLWRARPHGTDAGPIAPAVVVTPAPAAAYVTAALVPSPTPDPTTPGLSVDPGILVDVQGRVRRTGVVNLPAGARVRDAINAAGGARTGASTRSLNLAAPLVDGEQVVLGPTECASTPPTSAPAPAASFVRPARPAAAQAPAKPAQPAAPVLIDLNRATTAELETLPGVGPVLAQRIVDFRTTRGRFTSVDELREVSGIGPAKFAEIRRLVRV